MSTHATDTKLSSPSISLKLLIDTKGKRVLFAEAGKDFVDFLLSLMSLPIGTVVRLLSPSGDDDIMGSLQKLYESFENLNDSYIQPNANKDSLLKPQAPIFGGAATLLSLPCNSSIDGVFVCGNCRRYSTYNPKDKCPYCRETMSTAMSAAIPFVQAEASKDEGSSSFCGGGFVKGVVTYMVMDNLEVKPMSTISSIALLNNFSIKEIGVLQEKVVSMGMAEGLKLLKASLESKTVLTNVFLRK